MSPWRSELYWLALLAFFGLFLGKITGLYFFSLIACVLVYLARQLFHINRIALWLRSGGKVPQGSGIWEEIYYLIYRLRRRNKTRKKRLLAMLERFRTATAALPDATVVLGPRNEIDWFNEASERLLGLRKSDINQQICNLIRAPRFAEFLGNSDSNATISIPSPILDKIELEIRVVPYGEDLRLLIAQDVTHFRLLDRVQKDFVSNVSHELRTPLTVLRGYVETLMDDGADLPDRYPKVFSRMEEQISRMQKLVDGLLTLTKLESGALAGQFRVDVGALLKNVCDDAQVLRKGGQNLRLILESKADITGQESELRSAFSNLVVNALKYSGETSTVTVRWKDDAGGAVLEVEDDGPGIAAEHLPRLTERFYRAETGKSEGQSGVGLGLAIARHVMSRHEGELKIASELDKGSCFSCKFPNKRLLRPIA